MLSLADFMSFSLCWFSVLILRFLFVLYLVESPKSILDLSLSVSLQMLFSCSISPLLLGHQLHKCYTFHQISFFSYTAYSIFLSSCSLCFRLNIFFCSFSSLLHSSTMSYVLKPLNVLNQLFYSVNYIILFGPFP